jgi:hypothetical protein
VVFGVYALAVLAALLIFGRLSDHVGRRPVLLVTLAVQAVSLVVFTTAGEVPELLAARIIQGVSSGAALGAIGAGMLDIDRPRGTLANAVSPGMGSGAQISCSRRCQCAGLQHRWLPCHDRRLTVGCAGVGPQGLRPWAGPCRQHVPPQMLPNMGPTTAQAGWKLGLSGPSALITSCSAFES